MQPLGLGADSFAGAAEPVHLPGEKIPQPVHFELHVTRPIGICNLDRRTQHPACAECICSPRV